MKVAAPGKLMLAGAYAVLEGAPAIVLAVDRYAFADGLRAAASPTPEVLAAMAATDAPHVDAGALRQGPHKLGLGSSAAILVASLGVVRRRAGEDLSSAAVRGALFAEARRAHAVVQSGGSGVDVAASVHGGVLEYALEAGGGARVRALALPAEIVVDVFWCGVPATTTRMRELVGGLRRRAPEVYRSRLTAIGDGAEAAVSAAVAGDAHRFLVAVGRGASQLAELGRDAEAPIYPESTRGLDALAAADGAVFLPSGAGGGDVFVHVGTRRASPRFVEAAEAAGMLPVAMRVESLGVHLSG